MRGVVAAVPTPITDTGAPVEDLYLAHCQWLLANGCDGLNILGSTGEANSFDGKARKTVMRWAAGALDRSRLMVGTGTPSLAETIDLTSFADELGYEIALVLPPYYYKPLSDDGLFAWYARLHDALHGRKIQIYFYNYPQMTGLNIPVSVIERLHKTWPDRFKGIKDSSGKLEYCRELTALLPDLAVFPSSEVALSEAAQFGYAGCISATANQTSSLSAQLWSDRENPDATLVEKISKIRSTVASQPLIPAVKYLVSLQSGHSQWQHVIPPFLELDEAQKSALAEITDHLVTV